MALDQLTILVNRYRRLAEAEDPDESAIDSAYEAIEDYLRNNNKRFIIRASAEVEINTSELGDYDWLIDRLVEERQTIDEAMAADFEYDCTTYIGWDDVHLSIEDENGKKLGHVD